MTLPLSREGVIAGALLVFIPAVGEFVIPDLLGGSDTLMIGRTLWNDFFSNHDWPAASAAAIALVVLLMIPLLLVGARAAAGRGGTPMSRALEFPGRVARLLFAGFVFLYAPIVILAVDELQRVASRFRLGRLLNEMVRGAAGE